jgi:hypothetical protein
MINQAKRRTSVLTRIGLTDKVVNTANVFHATYRKRSEQESERQRASLVIYQQLRMRPKKTTRECFLEVEVVSPTTTNNVMTTRLTPVS